MSTGRMIYEVLGCEKEISTKKREDHFHFFGCSVEYPNQKANVYPHPRTLPQEVPTSAFKSMSILSSELLEANKRPDNSNVNRLLVAISIPV